MTKTPIKVNDIGLKLFELYKLKSNRLIEFR